jgi:hypothetical protein
VQSAAAERRRERQRLPGRAGPAQERKHGGKKGRRAVGRREKLGQRAEMKGREEGEGEFPFHFLKLLFQIHFQIIFNSLLAFR